VGSAPARAAADAVATPARPADCQPVAAGASVQAAVDGGGDALCLAPGVGKKVAGRIVLELKDRVGAGGDLATSGPMAATVMIAATTRSTGITSTVPSGTPGNSFRSPRA